MTHGQRAAQHPKNACSRVLPAHPPVQPLAATAPVRCTSNLISTPPRSTCHILPTPDSAAKVTRCAKPAIGTDSGNSELLADSSATRSIPAFVHLKGKIGMRSRSFARGMICKERHVWRTAGVRMASHGMRRSLDYLNATLVEHVES